jgi:hypothetical protein
MRRSHTVIVEMHGRYKKRAWRNTCEIARSCGRIYGQLSYAIETSTETLSLFTSLVEQNQMVVKVNAFATFDPDTLYGLRDTKSIL